MSLDIERLLTELTVEEKASLTSGSGFWWTAPVERLGIPRIMVSDGPHGLRAQPGSGDHVGIGDSVPATCFPTASALASSWDPTLLRRVGEALAAEARRTGVSVILGPGINIKRNPLCGRNFEYFSEDPYLTGELAVGIVDGIQSGGVGTSVKHYAANNQETDRLRVSAEVSERALREIYFPAFETVVRRCQPWTIMCSYNKINGVSASENPWLLTTVLREEWGFTGLVVSDWGAVYHRVPALLAGLDLEMPPVLPRSPQQVAEAVHSGTVSGELLDDRVRTVLELVAKGLDVAEAAGGAGGLAGPDYDTDAHTALAREAAARSIVLLRNDSRVLPLTAEGTVAVVGELARTPRFQGAGSSQVNPTGVTSILDALSDRRDVTFAAGYALENGPSTDGAGLVDEAVNAARAADTVVVVLGLPQSYESEGFDRTHMDLPAEQLDLLASVAEANPRVAVVVVGGSTVLLGDVLPHSQALLMAWLGGQEAGAGIADVLVGEANPSGKLAETIPHRLEDNSSFLAFPGDSQRVVYGEGVFVGYRGYDKAGHDVAFPFGHGLSYAAFDISGLEVSVSGDAAAGDLAATVSVDVTNTSDIAGAEVVQVYVRDPESSVTRPVRELRGFARVELSPGAGERVSIELDQRAFSFWSELLERFVVEAGDFVIEVGTSSRDLPLTQTISVDAPPVAAPLGADSTLHEWLADPAGQRILRRIDSERGLPMLADDLVPVIGTMPMSTLASFGMGLDHDDLDAALEEWETA